MRRRALLLAGGAAAAARGGASAQPAAAPLPPVVRLIIPFPAGGPTDAVGRLVGTAMGAELGRTVVIENRAGAGGTVGAEAAARAEPDGGTVVVTSIATHGIGPALFPRLPYDPVRDFASVGLIHESPLVVAVHPAVPARTLAALLDAARARPGEVGYATSGNGTSPHAAVELLSRRAGVRFQHVPYRGSAPAIVDAVAGTVPVLVDNIISAVEHVRAGRLRALAVTTAERAPLLPEVPTVAEQGFPGYAASSWMALAAPARTPEAAVARLNGALAAALARAEVRGAMAALGAVPRPGPPAALDAFVREELAKWAEVVRAAGMRVD